MTAQDLTFTRVSFKGRRAASCHALVNSFIYHQKDVQEPCGYGVNACSPYIPSRQQVGPRATATTTTNKRGLTPVPSLFEHMTGFNTCCTCRAPTATRRVGRHKSLLHTTCLRPIRSHLSTRSTNQDHKKLLTIVVTAYETNPLSSPKAMPMPASAYKTSHKPKGTSTILYTPPPRAPPAT